MTTYDDETLRSGSRAQALDTAWPLLVGAAAGAIAGLVVGGIGGRLAMLLLRITSPDHVIGLTSDDGFEIGVVSFDTVNLLIGMALFGGVNGVLYATLRNAIRQRARLGLWSLLGAVGVGANVIHADGVDFNVLEPTWLAIALFLALPLVAAAAVVVLVERWIDREPFADRRFSIGLVASAAAGTLALAFAALVGVAVLAARALGVAPLIGRVARIAVPVLICAAIVFYGIAAVDTIAELL